LTVTTVPAIKRVPVLGGSGFRAMLISTVPLPVSLDPEVIVSHDVPLVTEAVQEQKPAVVTSTFFVVFPSPTCIDVGVTVNEHGAAA
jgi:hypothetical protein